MRILVKAVLATGLLVASLGGDSAAADADIGNGLVYVSAGVLFVDVGASIFNGVSLAIGKPDRLNGSLGVAAGVVSFGLVLAGYLMTDDDDLRGDFAVVMGAAGTTSIVLGALNIRRDRGSPEESKGHSRLTMAPGIIKVGNGAYCAGMNLSVSF
jgi:hypothetical protein